MIVWGGQGTSALSDGARYNPTTDSWIAIPGATQLYLYLKPRRQRMGRKGRSMNKGATIAVPPLLRVPPAPDSTSLFTHPSNGRIPDGCHALPVDSRAAGREAGASGTTALNKPTQGNALGNRVHSRPSPERAAQRVAHLQGYFMIMHIHPGRCPGLACRGAFGPKTTPAPRCGAGRNLRMKMPVSRTLDPRSAMP